MFSGIIEKKQKILWVEEGRFTVKNIFWNDLKIGQSIAHDWACMTIESFDEDKYTFFVMEESLKKTNFWTKKTWDYFNIERCLKVNDRIDWHFVSGHIDTRGEISILKQKDDGSLIIWVRFEEDFSKYTIKKWSICINWVSLTIVDVASGYISVSLIPLTQDWTNLGNINLGDAVNLEFDLLGKYILNGKHDS